MSVARDIGLTIAMEASLLHHDGDTYGRIVDMAKSRCDPDRRHVTFFTYQQPMFMQQSDELHLSELDDFIRCMHGKSPQV
jgi:beta-amylase